MKTSRLPILLLALMLACGPARLVAAGQSVTQSITLQPGWNAVWLEVEPTNNASGVIFSNLPVAGVWTRVERLASAEYIQNPSETAFNQPGWQRWLPPWRDASFFNNLFFVNANRPYLLRCTNVAPLVWNVTGRPPFRRPQWVPDAFNLRGLPVDPTNPPTFLSFFQPSAAHYDTTTTQLQPIYRLDSTTGQWVAVSPGDAMQSGSAYWIYTKGASDYLAPLDLKLDVGDGLDFGNEDSQLAVRLENLSSAPLNALLRDLAGASNSILSYSRFDTNQGTLWPALPSVLAVATTPTQEVRLQLAVRRQDLAGDNYESVMEVRDGAGTRLLVPVSAQKEIGIVGGSPSTNALAGLWVGTATLNAVSEANSTNPNVPTPTKSDLNLRLILHVDGSGQVRLLKEVIQMWRDGTTTNDSRGNAVVDKPGEYVLLTDDTKIGQFKGASVRDGTLVGRRLSTVGYDFPSATSSNFLNMTGSFGPGQTLNVTIPLPYDHPDNPFLHRYHPDHDNLNTTFSGPAIESYSVTRQVELDIASPPPVAQSVPDYGFNEFDGAYHETITGLHKNSLYVSGTFRLRRLSYAAELNPNPNP